MFVSQFSLLAKFSNFRESKIKQTTKFFLNMEEDQNDHGNRDGFNPERDSIFDLNSDEYVIQLDEPGSSGDLTETRGEFISYDVID